MASNTLATSRPEDWTFEGSNNDIDWTVLDTQTGQSFSGYTTKYYLNIGNTTAYRYYRINISQNGGAINCGITNLQIYQDLNESSSSLSSPSSASFSSGSFSSYSTSSISLSSLSSESTGNVSSGSSSSSSESSISSSTSSESTSSSSSLLYSISSSSSSLNYSSSSSLNHSSSSSTSSSSSYDDSRNIVVVYDNTNYLFNAYEVNSVGWTLIAQCSHTLSSMGIVIDLCENHVVVAAIDSDNYANDRVVVNFVDVLNGGFIWGNFEVIDYSITDEPIIDMDVNGFAKDNLSSASIAWITYGDNCKIYSSVIDINGLQNPTDLIDAVIYEGQNNIVVPSDYTVDSYLKIGVEIDQSFDTHVFCGGAKNTIFHCDGSWDSDQVKINGISGIISISKLSTSFYNGLCLSIINNESDVYYFYPDDNNGEISYPDMILLNNQWASHQQYRNGSLESEKNIYGTYLNRSGVILKDGKRDMLLTANGVSYIPPPPLPQSSSSSFSESSITEESESSFSSISSHSSNSSTPFIWMSSSSSTSYSSDSTSLSEGFCSKDLVPIMTSAISPSPYVIYSPHSPHAYLAFDGNLTTYMDGVMHPSQDNTYISIDLGSGNEEAICRLDILTDFPGDIWLNGEVEIRGSNDGVTYDVLYNINSDNVLGLMNNSYFFENETAYRYYRIYIIANVVITSSDFHIKMMQIYAFN